MICNTFLTDTFFWYISRRSSSSSRTNAARNQASLNYGRDVSTNDILLASFMPLCYESWIADEFARRKSRELWSFPCLIITYCYDSFFFFFCSISFSP